MNWLPTRLMAAVAFAVVITMSSSPLRPALAQVQERVSLQTLVGNYKVSGRNADGSPYSGTLKIAPNGEALRFEWSVGGRSYNGLGRLTGNVLVVDWGSSSPVIYTVGADGSLAGTWNDGRASERLVRR